MWALSRDLYSLEKKNVPLNRKTKGKSAKWLLYFLKLTHEGEKWCVIVLDNVLLILGRETWIISKSRDFQALIPLPLSNNICAVTWVSSSSHLSRNASNLGKQEFPGSIVKGLCQPAIVWGGLLNIFFVHDGSGGRWQSGSMCFVTIPDMHAFVPRLGQHPVVYNSAQWAETGCSAES